MKRGINMKMIQIVIVFLSLFVVLGGLSLPLWWNAAMPYVFQVPAQIESVIRNMYNLFDLVMKSV